LSDSNFNSDFAVKEAGQIRAMRNQFRHLVPKAFDAWRMYVFRKRRKWAAVKRGIACVQRWYFMCWQVFVTEEKEERVRQRQQRKEAQIQRAAEAEQTRQRRLRVCFTVVA
jgi:hypothetical protein